MKDTIEIHIYIGELIYDCERTAYQVGESIRNGKNDEAVALLQDIIDEEALNVILRSFGESMGIVKDKLHEYLVDENHQADNMLMERKRKVIAQGIAFSYKGQPQLDKEDDDEEDNDFILMLRVPTNFSRAAKDAISHSIHSYMVHAALASWYNMSAPKEIGNSVTISRELVKNCQDECTSSLLMLEEAMNRRVRPKRVRRPSEIPPHTNDIRYE